MMGTWILVGVVSAAVLVMTSGIWVAAALIAAVSRAGRPAPAAKDHSVGEAGDSPPGNL